MEESLIDAFRRQEGERWDELLEENVEKRHHEGGVRLLMVRFIEQAEKRG